MTLRPNRFHSTLAAGCSPGVRVLHVHTSTSITSCWCNPQHFRFKIRILPLLWGNGTECQPLDFNVRSCGTSRRRRWWVVGKFDINIRSCHPGYFSVPFEAASRVVEKGFSEERPASSIAYFLQVHDPRFIPLYSACAVHWSGQVCDMITDQWSVIMLSQFLMCNSKCLCKSSLIKMISALGRTSKFWNYVLPVQVG